MHPPARLKSALQALKNPKVVSLIILALFWSAEALPALVEGERSFWHASELGGTSLLEELSENRNATNGEGIKEYADGILNDHAILTESARAFDEFMLCQAANISSVDDYSNVTPPKSALGEMLDALGLNALFGTLLETRSYYVLTKVYNESTEEWDASWITPTSAFPRPEIRFIDDNFPGGLASELLRTPVDIDNDSEAEYYIMITLERSWGIDGLRPYLKYAEADIAIDNVSVPSAVSITVLRPISFDDKEYLWSLTENFSSLPANYTFRARMDGVRFSSALEILDQIISNRSASLKFSTIDGPLSVSLEMTEHISSLSFSAGYSLRQGGALSDASLIGFDLSNPYMSNKVTVDVTPNFSSQVRYLKWLSFEGANANMEKKAIARLHYYDEKACDDGCVCNETYMATFISPLPSELSMSLLNVSKNAEPLTDFRFSTSDPVDELVLDDIIISKGNVSNEGHLRLASLPEHFSILINYDAMLESSPIRAVQPPVFNNSLLPRVLNFDSIMQYVASIFYNIGVKLRGLPYKILYDPTRDLNMRLETEHPIGEIEIYALDGARDYAEVADADQITFYKNGTKASASVRFTGLGNSTIIMGDNKRLDLTFALGARALKVVSLFAFEGAIKSADVLSLFPLPERINMTMTDGEIDYNGSRPLDNLTWLSDGDDHFELSLVSVPCKLHIIQRSGESSLSCSAPICETAFAFSTNKTLSRLPFQHILVYRTDHPSERFVSARLYNLTGFSLIATKEGESSNLRLRISGDSRAPMRVVVKNATVNLAEQLDASFYLSRLPRELYFNYSATSEMSPPESLYVMKVNTTVVGLSDIASVLSSIASLGEVLLSTAMNLSSYLSDNLGLGTSVSFSYSCDGALDLLGTIDKGGLLLGARWQPGVFLGVSGASFQLRLFLRGLPSRGTIALTNANDGVSLFLDLAGYKPSHDRLLITENGMKAGESDLCIGLACNAYFERLLLNLSVRLKDSANGLSTSGFARLESAPPGQFTTITGELVRPLGNTRTTVRFALSSLPSSINASFALEPRKKVELDYSGSAAIGLLHLSVAQEKGKSKPEATITLRDVPTSASARIFMRGDPGNLAILSPMSGLPDVAITTNDQTLDLLAEFDGRLSGVSGKYRIYAENLSDLTCKLSDRYNIRSNGSKSLSISIDGAGGGLVKMERLTLYSEGLKRASLLIATNLFVYPTINIDGLEAKCLQLSFSSKLLGILSVYAVALTTNPLASRLNHASFGSGNSMLVLALVPTAVLTMPALVPITIALGYFYRRWKGKGAMKQRR